MLSCQFTALDITTKKYHRHYVNVFFSFNLASVLSKANKKWDPYTIILT